MPCTAMAHSAFAISGREPVWKCRRERLGAGVIDGSADSAASFPLRTAVDTNCKRL